MFSVLTERFMEATCETSVLGGTLMVGMAVSAINDSTGVSTCLESDSICSRGTDFSGVDDSTTETGASGGRIDDAASG